VAAWRRCLQERGGGTIGERARGRKPLHQMSSERYRWSATPHHALSAMVAPSAVPIERGIFSSGLDTGPTYLRARSEMGTPMLLHSPFGRSTSSDMRGQAPDHHGASPRHPVHAQPLERSGADIGSKSGDHAMVHALLRQVIAEKEATIEALKETLESREADVRSATERNAEAAASRAAMEAQVGRFMTEAAREKSKLEGELRLVRVELAEACSVAADTPRLHAAILLRNSEVQALSSQVAALASAPSLIADLKQRLHEAEVRCMPAYAAARALNSQKPGHRLVVTNSHRRPRWRRA
jgi:hypothetical protein